MFLIIVWNWAGGNNSDDKLFSTSFCVSIAFGVIILCMILIFLYLCFCDKTREIDDDKPESQKSLVEINKQIKKFSSVTKSLI